MSEFDVRIVRLKPMRVASALGFGKAPETLAWKKILTWVESKGLLTRDATPRFFGFNNPSPSPGSPDYGYEQWIAVGPEVQAAGDVEIKEFPGGLFAVARCKGIPNIGPTWEQLAEWLKKSPYQPGHHQWLEETLTPLRSLADFEKASMDDFVMDLYLPIGE